MAATAYAALVSLMNIITRYQHPTCPVSFDKLQMQTLLEKAGVLVEFLENYYSETRNKGSTIQNLERRMTIAANAAEAIIECSYVDRLLKRKEMEFYPDMQEAVVDLNQIIQQTVDFGVKKHKRDPQVLFLSFFFTSHF